MVFLMNRQRKPATRIMLLPLRAFGTMRQRAHISLQTSLQPPPFYLQTQTRSSTRSSRYVAVHTNPSPSSLCRESVPKFPVSLFYSFFSLRAYSFPIFFLRPARLYAESLNQLPTYRCSRRPRPSSVILFSVSAIWVKATLRL